MRFLIAAIVVLFAQNLKSEVRSGQKAPNLCWTDENEKQVCLEDYKDKVRVLLYNGGFCGPCNEEFRELSPNAGNFSNDPVIFLSLSVAGWQSSSKPSPEFLKEWKHKHYISFPVLASNKKDLYRFIANPALPSTVIIDRNGNVVFAQVAPDVYWIFDKIRELF